jgi:NSS family neurotransmitter:Na+ symporter
MAEANNGTVGWSSRWTFVMAATGSAVGLGNIWKFPYITGEYGGGAFVLVYLLCIILVGVPVMMAEVLIGRQGRSDPIHSVLTLARAADASKLWTCVGIMGVIAGLVILSFYSVVAGWAVDYVMVMSSGSLKGANADMVGQNFTQLLSNIPQLLASHTLFILFTCLIVGFGVTQGLGLAVRILMPILFLLLVVLMGYAFTNGDFESGLNFMFNVDFSKLTGEAVLVALGHAFFTLSLGMGSIMVYGAYMPGSASIGSTVLTVAFLDTVIALGAGMAIFPLVYANGLEPGSGPGLMFVTLPIAFGQMPGGVIFGTLFFVLVCIAAWSSAISLIEPGVAWLERMGIKRWLGTGLFGLICWGGGVACIYSNNWNGDKPEGIYVFESLDYIASNIMLPLGGLLIAIFAGWIIKRNTARKQLMGLSELMFNLWYVTLRFLAPAGVLAIFAHSMGLLEGLV